MQDKSHLDTLMDPINQSGLDAKDGGWTEGERLDLILI